MVYDVHIYVNAVVGPDSEYPRIHPVPPSSDNPSPDCLSIAFDGDYRLHVSPHILRNVGRVLGQLGWSAEAIGDYLALISDVVDASGGAVTDPPKAAHSSRDHEDNLILDVVAATDADLLVSDDTDLTSLSPWRGVPIVRPHQFVQMVVRERRHSI
ncbi:putative toxin-antitoxin system toxin component, PIN family [Agromyces bauzanensis]|uniref:putative toxin-antitoxin system toxin component, PIN family n=1 Tax=Agromyces bauzanensis TaxID=1308924 RepID=UPI00227C965D|nr:putative toxin-antitoxin system toxin component, PIN family [Agromyces bauzanensis]